MEKAMQRLDNLIQRRPEISVCRESIEKSFQMMVHSLKSGGKLIICGNGGSASDALHFVGELIKGFEKKRELLPEEAQRLSGQHPEIGPILAKKMQRPLRAIELNSSCSITSAINNDNGAEMQFAQQLYALGDPKDIFVGISTSGNSQNVIYAIYTAKALGMKTIGLVGRNGGKMNSLVDVAIVAPGTSTPEIQECHLPIYHTLSLMLEEAFFKN